MECTEDFAAQADAQGVDLLLFPECFLQGYLVEERHVRRARARPALRQVRGGAAAAGTDQQTLVLGVIERPTAGTSTRRWS